MLSIRGTVLPVTLSKSTLVARLKDGSSVVGEANIDQRSENLDVPIDYVYLEPKAYAYPPVLEAIETADAIIMGPGDIYTSILPNLLVEDVSEGHQEFKCAEDMPVQPDDQAGRVRWIQRVRLRESDTGIPGHDQPSGLSGGQ